MSYSNKNIYTEGREVLAKKPTIITTRNIEYLYGVKGHRFLYVHFMDSLSRVTRHTHTWQQGVTLFSSLP